MRDMPPISRSYFTFAGVESVSKYLFRYVWLDVSKESTSNISRFCRCIWVRLNHFFRRSFVNGFNMEFKDERMVSCDAWLLSFIYILRITVRQLFGSLAGVSFSISAIIAWASSRHDVLP